MKRLLLIRHGDAPSISNYDMERSLSLRGEEQVNIASSHLKTYKIDNILCSPTKRTKQTLQIIQNHLNFNEKIIEFCHQIYSNSLEQLLLLVNNMSNDNETVLIIGHNPSLLELALTYDNNADDKWHDELDSGLKPAEIIVLEFRDSSCWSKLERGNGKIIDIFVP